MEAWAYTLASVLVVSLLSLAGIASLFLRRDRVQRASLLLVAFAVGGLLGDSFLHLLPEAVAKLGSAPASLLVIAGIGGFFVLEKALRAGRYTFHLHDVQPMVPMNLIGDGLHNLVDGMLIAASFAASRELGLATSLAVAMHELPHEFGDFGVLVRGGLSVRRAVLMNLLSALAAVVGAVATLAAGLVVEPLTAYLLPITAGNFLYIAGAQLIPELQHERTTAAGTAVQAALVAAGVAIMALLLRV